MEHLGGIFMSGEVVPETGHYLLLDNSDDFDPKDSGADVVVMFYQGDPFPYHPDTGGNALWRFVRVVSTKGHEVIGESSELQPAGAS